MTLEFENNQESEVTNDLLDQLQEFLESEEIKQLDITIDNESFKISSPDQANYFIKKLKEAEAEVEHIKAMAKREKDRLIDNIKKWEEDQIALQDNSINYVSRLLEDFYSEIGDGKALKLPNGTISYRKQQDKYDYIDELLVIESLEKIDNTLLRYKASIDKVPLKKKAIVKDGNLFIDDKLIEGVLVTPQEPKFTIK